MKNVDISFQNVYILLMVNAAFDRRTLRERATAQIRQLIIGGDLEPGEHVVEVRLS